MTSGAVTLPGAVNAHTHLYSGLVPLGMPAPGRTPRNFVEILARVWWRLDRALDEASLRAAAELYIAESLLAGTTTLVDHHESPSFIDGSLDVLGDAAGSLGCRLVTCFGATDRNGGRDEGRRGLRECERFVRDNRRTLVRGVVGLHASFTVGDETVREAGALARSLSVPVHVHVAEDAADVEDARRRGFAGPLERLLGLGALPAGSILAHGVWLSEAQVRAANDAGLWLVHNPRSNAGNRVGWAGALTAGDRVALGTDGYPADMRAEGAALAAHALAAGQPLDEASRRARLEGGFALAAERFGVPLGPLVAPGETADLAIWGSGADATTPGAAPLRVLVAGRPVVEDGRLVHGDIEAIRARAREQAKRLWARMSAFPEEV
jgi:cytosine/adenosine deaminase-related metal-dependent hydrolase